MGSEMCIRDSGEAPKEPRREEGGEVNAAQCTRGSTPRSRDFNAGRSLHAEQPASRKRTRREESNDAKNFRRDTEEDDENPRQRRTARADRSDDRRPANQAVWVLSGRVYNS